MSVILKKDTWKIKDPNTGEYRDSSVFATTFADDISSILEETADAIDAQETRAAGIVSDTSASLTAQETRAAGIVSDAQSDIDTIAASVQSMTQTGTDTTLTVSGAAADSKAVGDEVNDLKSNFSDVSAYYNLYDPKASYTQANAAGQSRTGYTINADGSIKNTRDLGGYGQVLLWDNSRTLQAGTYAISGKATMLGSSPTSIQVTTRVGVSETYKSPYLTTERGGSTRITSGDNEGWFFATFTVSSDQAFCFEVIAVSSNQGGILVENLLITRGTELLEYSENVYTAEDKIARGQTQVVPELMTRASNIEDYLELFGAYTKIKIIEKGASTVTQYYAYPFLANKTYIVINNTSSTATFYTRTGSTSDSTAIDAPFGANVVNGRYGEFTASADANYFSTYNNGSGTLIIAEKIENSQIFNSVENLGEYGIIRARTFYKTTSTTSYQYQYAFTAGKSYTVINNTEGTITFQTRETKAGSAIDALTNGLGSGKRGTFVATQNANWFNSYSEHSGSIIVGETVDLLGDDIVRRTDIFNGEPYTGTYDWKTPVSSYGALFKGKTATSVESFAFFSDPHIMGFADDSPNTERMQNYLKRVQTTYNHTPCSFVVSGGDWLNNATTMDEACYRLGLIKGFSNHLLDDFYLVLGNHDTNYQGKLDADSDNNTGRLTNDTIAALLYRDTDTKKAYYSFDGANSKCYALDTGIEHNTMLDYDWEQVAWLANKLKTDDAAHSIIFSHMIIVSSEVQTNVSNFASIVQAYNSRTTVTLNSIEYSFTSCTGKVEFWVAGHMHQDTTGTIGGIPYFLSATNSFNSDVPLIDLVLADYTNRTVYLKRVGGTGEDRTISLV